MKYRHFVKFSVFTLVIVLSAIFNIISLTADESKSKTKEERLRELRLEEAEIELRQKRISRDEKRADYENMKSLFDAGLVSIQELNDAKKDMENSQLEYETAKLKLQMSELESLKAAWHISIVDTEVKDEGDQKIMTITLENTSEEVTLERTQKMIDEKIIEPVDTTVNPEINDIYVSIKEGESIISDPYERYIESLKIGEPVTLTFTLIKDVEDVVVSLRYEEQEDRRNIHLEKIEPYISVVKAIKYRMDNMLFELGTNFMDDLNKEMLSQELRKVFEDKEITLSPDVIVSVTQEDSKWVLTDRLNDNMYFIEGIDDKLSVYSDEDKLMLYVVLRNGAVEKEGERFGESEQIDQSSSETSVDSTGSTLSTKDRALNDINNIYVSIMDNERNIVGIPYEIRIPLLKLGEQKGYRFELQKDVNSVVVSMNYLKKEDSKNVYLEPDTRHISIKSAQVRMLSNTSDIEPDRRGKKEVTLELVNRSETGKMPFSEDLLEISGVSTRATSEIRNVFVSLKHNGVVVARPYEAVIDRLEYNKPRKLDFVLQKTDIDDVTVNLSYLGREEEEQVYLEKVSPEDVVTVNSDLFAQEGPLGESVSYDLTLERLAEAEKIFKLRVINLPEQFTYQFNDSESGSRSRVTQIKFTHAQSNRNLSLEIFLPEEMDLSLLDKPLDFYAAVLSEEEDAKYEPGRLNMSPEELDQLKAGKVRLVLTPRGVPEFEVIAQNLYFEIKPDERVNMLISLKNTGTRDLSDIRITTELPSNRWKSEIQPDILRSLDRQEEKEINITIIPPDDVSVGDTEVRILAECEVDNREIEAPEKNVRIHITGKTNITGSVILIGFLILLVVGIAILTVRLSRR